MRITGCKVIYGEGLVFKGGTHRFQPPDHRRREGQGHRRQPAKHPAQSVQSCGELLKAAKGEETCRSNFAVAGPLCQAMAIGILAQRVNAKLQFDLATKQITNHKVTNALLKGVPSRKDWKQYSKP